MVLADAYSEEEPNFGILYREQWTKDRDGSVVGRLLSVLRIVGVCETEVMDIVADSSDGRTREERWRLELSVD